MTLSPHLLHLAIERNYRFDFEKTISTDMSLFGLINKHFPNLETLTVLITNPKMYLAADPTASTAACLTHYQDFNPRLPTEVDGEIDMNFAAEDMACQALMEFERAMIQSSFDILKAKNGGKMPVLKFRDQRQFLEGREVLN